MSIRLVIACSVAALVAAGMESSAFAQEKTRAEVRQELIQAQNSGLRYVTDTSYPDVNPLFAQRVAGLRQIASDTGSEVTGSSASGAARMTQSICAGPVSFCNPYFGN